MQSEYSIDISSMDLTAPINQSEATAAVSGLSGDTGIDCFVLHKERPVYGMIKQRPEDFLVNEIGEI